MLFQDVKKQNAHDDYRPPYREARVNRGFEWSLLNTPGVQDPE